MARRLKAAKKRTAPQAIVDAATFRRALHSLGPLHRGLNHHRGRVPVDRVIPILHEVSAGPAYLSAFVTAPFPVDYEDIKLRRAIKPAGPLHDLLWNAGVLGLYTTELTLFVRQRDTFYAALSGGDYEHALQILDDIERALGVSSWLMFSRLLLIQLYKGTSAQKEFLDSIIDRPNLNVFFAYLAFYYSFGLEDHVSVPELNREFEALSEQGAGRDVIAYFRYHASPAGLSAVDDPYVCITLEENSPIVDRFETFVEMSQLIFIRSDDVDELNALKLSLEQLRGVPDLRVSNLSSLLNSAPPPMADDDFLAACEAYTAGDESTASALTRYALSRTSASAWWFELAALLGVERSYAPETPALCDRVISELHGYLSLTYDTLTPEIDLQKLALLARKQPAAVCVAAFLDRKADLSIDGTFNESQALWAISSPLPNPKHLRLLQKLAPGSEVRVIAATASPAPTATTLHESVLNADEASKGVIDRIEIPKSRRARYQGHAAFNGARFAEAAENYRAAMEIQPSPRSDVVRSLYHALVAAGHLDDACELFVHQHFLNPLSIIAFPLSDLVRIAVAKGSIDEKAITRAIALNIALRTGATAAPGDVSDAYEDVLDHHACLTPSELIQADHGIDHARFCYFLANVCTIETMEDGTVFDVYDDVEAERVAILQWLIPNDPDRRKIYSAEIASIVKDQEVAALEQHLDRSRLFVDEAGVRRQLDPELRDAFIRYKQLLGEPALDLRVEGIEQRMRKLLKSSEIDTTGFHLPSTEREGLFRSLYSVSLDGFGLNPAHGFQTYLSTRVLHGSIEGELRNSFSSRSLMLSDDPEEARLECRALWGEKLGHDEGALLDLFRILSRFSDRTTEKIQELKTKYVRVRTTETPEALFDFEADPDTFARIRAGITVDTTYDELQRQLLDHFWDLVEQSLPAVIARIDTVRTQVIGYAENAVKSIKAHRVLAMTDLADQFTHGLTDFFTNCDRAKSWFSRSGALPAEPFDLTSASRLAAKIVNKCHPAHPIEPQVCVEEGVIDGIYLNASVDLLSNCFANVVQHSGVEGRAPLIEVTAANKGDRFDLLVKGELGEVLNTADVEAVITERLTTDVDGSGAMVEGGSGLRKMQRIVRHDYGFGETLTVSIGGDRMVVVACPVPRREADA